MEQLAKDFPKSQHLFIYTREAHPGEAHGPHRTFEDKRESALKMARHEGIARRMLVDDLDGTVHRAYGCLPNMSFVIARRGRLAFRASWTDARMLRLVLTQMQHEKDAGRGFARMLPYHVEWQPMRPTDRKAFLLGLRNSGGERAVQEYIDEIGQLRGEGERAALNKVLTKLNAESEV